MNSNHKLIRFSLKIRKIEWIKWLIKISKWINLAFSWHQWRTRSKSFVIWEFKLLIKRQNLVFELLIYPIYWKMINKVIRISFKRSMNINQTCPKREEKMLMSSATLVAAFYQTIQFMATASCNPQNTLKWDPRHPMVNQFLELL